jgi:hypothetical protein
VAEKPRAGSRLHPEVEKYRDRVNAVRVRAGIDDNSNTQFGVLGTWVARKYGVPCDTALDAIEKRFLTSQNSGGGWSYAGSTKGTPSMTCAGLLALATSIARREERLLPPASTKNGAATNRPGEGPGQAAAPLASSPPAKSFPDAKTDPVKRPPDSLDKAAEKALTSLGPALAANPKGKGARFNINGGTLGDRDLYFLWSVERVGVVYGLQTIAGVDWYDAGAEDLVATQNLSGSWGRGGKGAEVDTSFALLFLVRSNPSQDLSLTLQKGFTTTELRGGGPLVSDPSRPPGGSTGKVPMDPEPTEPRRPGVIVIRPSGTTTDDEAKQITAELVKSMGSEWDTVLKKTRDATGLANTQALVKAIGQLDGDRLRLAREALAERLSRSSADGLRSTAKSTEPELRRATARAMALKEDKTFLPDLIAAILDEDEHVWLAAKEALKSLTGQDFGPETGALSSERKAAAAAWREWLSKQKK